MAPSVQHKEGRDNGRQGMSATRMGIIIIAIVMVAASLVALPWRHGAPRSIEAGSAAVADGLSTPWRQGPRLVMFSEAGCPWCALFHKEITPIYANTEEGKAAPLLEVDVTKPRPPELRHVGKIVYTPTFVLIDGKGAIVGRIEGYPGFDFFWQRLDELLEKMRARQARAGTNNNEKVAAGG